MNWHAMAIVQICCTGELLKYDDVQKIETLLRNGKDINNLSVHSDRMTFFMWAKDRVDYGVLNQIKERLTNTGKEFLIFAQEYLSTDRQYSYSAAPADSATLA